MTRILSLSPFLSFEFNETLTVDCLHGSTYVLPYSAGIRCSYNFCRSTRRPSLSPSLRGPYFPKTTSFIEGARYPSYGPTWIKTDHPANLCPSLPTSFRSVFSPQFRTDHPLTRHYNIYKGGNPSLGLLGFQGRSRREGDINAVGRRESRIRVQCDAPSFPLPTHG